MNKYVTTAAVLMCLALGWLWLRAGNAEKRGYQKEREAAMWQGQAIANADAANEAKRRELMHEEQAGIHAAKAAVSENKVVGLKAEVAKLKREISTPTPDDAHGAVISKLEEVIAEQDATISELKAERSSMNEQILDLTTSRDQFEKAYLNSQRQAAAQAAATESWKSAVRSSEMKGAVKGAGVGAVAWEITRRLLHL